MKAINRKTKEIIDIISFSGDTRRSELDRVSYIDSKGVEQKDVPLNRYWDFEEIEYGSGASPTVDDLYQKIFRSVLGGLCASSDRTTFKLSPEDICKSAIEITDTAISELRKKYV